MASPGTAVNLASAADVVQGSYRKFSRCAMSIDFISAMVSAIGGEEQALEDSMIGSLSALPPQIWMVVKATLGVALLLIGFKFIRPINFAAGTYLTTTLCILLLTLFAPQTTGCGVVVGIPVTVGLAAGVFCARVRTSMFAAIGIVVGEVIGRLFYSLTLQPLGAPEYLAFSCIGFFAVVVACLLYHIGDPTWIVVCSIAGSYLLVASLLQLCIAPILPQMGVQRFAEFRWPDITELGSSYYNREYARYIAGDAAIWLPLLLVLGLAAYGYAKQQALLAKDKVQAEEKKIEVKAKAAARHMT